MDQDKLQLEIHQDTIHILRDHIAELEKENKELNMLLTTNVEKYQQKIKELKGELKEKEIQLVDAQIRLADRYYYIDVQEKQGEAVSPFLFEDVRNYHNEEKYLDPRDAEIERLQEEIKKLKGKARKPKRKWCWNKN